MITLVDDDYIIRSPGTPEDRNPIPFDDNPFPIGSIIRLDVSHPKVKQARTDASHFVEIGSGKSKTLELEVIHVFWPPTLSTVYRVRRPVNAGNFTKPEADVEEFVLKVFDPRFSNERIYRSNLLGRFDIGLKWSDKNECAARQFLQSERETFFSPGDGLGGLLDPPLGLIRQINRERCVKEDEAERIQCEPYIASPCELEMELGKRECRDYHCWILRRSRLQRFW